MLKKLNMNWTAKTLTAQMERGNATFDCAIQRGYAWDRSRDSLLIHSMIEGYPIPAFFFSKTDTGVYDGLDGKQRSAAISKYIKGEYALHDDFEIVRDEDNEEHDFSGKYFEELPEWAQDAIKDYNLTIYYFDGLTDEERDNMFFRLNNGKPLSAIELTRVRAKSLAKFQEMAQHDIVKLAVTERGRIRYNHENLTMQVWAACFVDDVRFETKPFREIIENAEVEQEELDTINSCFDVLLEIYNSYDLTTPKEKRHAKRIVTRTHTVSLTRAAKIALENNYDIERFKEWAKLFFSGTTSASISDKYNTSCGAGSARKDKVDARMAAILEDMSEYFKRSVYQDQESEEHKEHEGTDTSEGNETANDE